MKNVNDISFMIQARLDSKRLPGKMLLPFGESNLFEIAIQKLVDCKSIPNRNIYLALYDQELKDIAGKYPSMYFTDLKTQLVNQKNLELYRSGVINYLISGLLLLTHAHHY